jgi:hypothetical protein
MSGRATRATPCVSCTRRLAALLRPSRPYRVVSRFPELGHKEVACFLGHLVTPAPNVAPVRAYHCSLPCPCFSLRAQISQSQASPAMLETTPHPPLQPLSGHLKASTFSILDH